MKLSSKSKVAGSAMVFGATTVSKASRVMAARYLQPHGEWNEFFVVFINLSLEFENGPCFWSVEYTKRTEFNSDIAVTIRCRLFLGLASVERLKESSVRINAYMSEINFDFVHWI